MTPDEFKRWRKALNLTQDRAAGALDVTTRAVQQWEAGDRPIERRTELACRYLAEHPEALNENASADTTS
ncbi:helix-turn-helix domain-containing protein [Azospirillum sp. sgz302134]